MKTTARRIGVSAGRLLKVLDRIEVEKTEDLKEKTGAIYGVPNRYDELLITRGVINNDDPLYVLGYFFTNNDRPIIMATIFLGDLNFSQINLLSSQPIMRYEYLGNEKGDKLQRREIDSVEMRDVKEELTRLHRSYSKIKEPENYK